MKQSKKRTLRLIYMLLAAFCLLGNMTPTVAEEIPRVIFENSRETAPHLYVRKTVESTDSRYPVPEDAVFMFTLSLEGKLVENMSYRVQNAIGQEIYQYEEGESTEDNANKIPYVTDRSGTFTLKDGQTAVFEYVGSGKSYVVTELPQEHFEQIVPAGGVPAAGTITPEGSVASFTNQYTPSAPNSQTTSIVVNKGIAFPDGYEVPDSPEFTFSLKLKNKAYAQEDYTITDTKTGLNIGTGTTNAEGGFSLKIGETATFEEVPVEVDYEIREEAAEGWRVVGAATYEGATKAPVTTINYTNASASFGVTKALSDNTTPDIEFTFQLTDNMQNGMAGVKYYLYTTGGTRVDNTEHQTDTKGKFSLKPGQSAIFFGVDPATIYNVSEEGNPDYIQKVPNNSEGYKNKEVSNAIEILPFVNEAAPEGKALTVTKRISSESGEVPLAEDTFTFRLTKKNGSTYEPVANAVYSIAVGSSAPTFATNADGEFSLKRNETARFEALKSGEIYKVEELDLTEEYKIEEAEQEEMLEEQINFIFENTFISRAVNLYLHKKDSKGNWLEGARFDLFTDELLVNKINETTLVSDGSGNISIPDLKAGTYYLVEVQAPEGYQLLTNPIKIELTRDENGIYAVIDEKEYRSTDSSDSIYIEKGGAEGDGVHITVMNRRNFGLPITGSIGVLTLILEVLAGILLLSWFMRKRHK